MNFSTEGFSDFQCGPDKTPKCDESLSKLCIKFSDGSRVCPADCGINGGCNGLDGTKAVGYHGALTEVNNQVSGTVLKVTPAGDLVNYVKLYNINDSVSTDTNCWLNCMSTSQCVGYKWDSAIGACTMYSDMAVTPVTKLQTETIKWMCTDTMTCTFSGLLGGTKDYVGTQDSKYLFQPDPECPVFQSCNNPSSSMVGNYKPRDERCGPGSGSLNCQVLMYENGLFPNVFDAVKNNYYFDLPDSAKTLLGSFAPSAVYNGTPSEPLSISISSTDEVSLLLNSNGFGLIFDE